ncbi:MAG: helix-hairpin-helix domain-containing protein [Candidatus Omnitrophica bacterium]|nr:helix-hairpin-helix domain-containing protein [Candidatus Omnitrophota bacterium]
MDSLIAQQASVNINSLDVNELCRLSGIGQVLAERIVEYHRANGPFTTKEELMQVKGIGEKKFKTIKDLIVLQ